MAIVVVVTLWVLVIGYLVITSCGHQLSAVRYTKYLAIQGIFRELFDNFSLMEADGLYHKYVYIYIIRHV